MKKIILIINTIFFLSAQVNADELKSQILTMKDRAELRDRFIKDRMKTVLPKIMDRTEIDMWIIIAREYNEDLANHASRYLAKRKKKDNFGYI